MRLLGILSPDIICVRLKTIQPSLPSLTESMLETLSSKWSHEVMLSTFKQNSCCSEIIVDEIVVRSTYEL